MLLERLIKKLPGNKKNGFEFMIRQLEVVLIFTVLYWLSGYFHLYFPKWDPYVRTTWGMDPEARETEFEPWPIVDCFYFALVTQTTVGYGDLIPHTRVGRYINILQLLTMYGVLAIDLF